MGDDRTGEWWRPAPGSKWEQRFNFVGVALTIAMSALALAGVTWTLASSQDGRMKALLWWCYGITAAGAYVIFAMRKREHREMRFARALEPLHLAHHWLRDAAYQRYIVGVRDADWKCVVEESLRHFTSAFAVATGSSCHATIKTLSDPTGAGGRAAPAEELEVGDFVRSAARAATLRPGVPRNTVGRNSDFRRLFSVDGDNNTCWYNNDLLLLGDAYDNPHWPERPTRRNVPYRSTMVWPIRKVLRPGSTTEPEELYIHGFLTVDSSEPGIFEYERHFHLGAAYADHLMAVLWDPDELKKVTKALEEGNGPAPTSAIENKAEEAVQKPTTGG